MNRAEKLQPNNTSNVLKQVKRLILLDAHAIIHRAYHALPDFATSTGEPTGALYGLTAMILKIISDLKPDYIIAAYDLPKPTYRHQVYEGYKSGRAKTEDALVLQLERSKELVEALNIPIYSKESFEADDILGTIVEKLRNKKVEIIIASGDMDTLQLVDDAGKNFGGVKVYTLKKGLNDTVMYTEEEVKKRFGFEPKLLPDYKGLRGDPSDNIIGIQGIGEKTATDLIKNFGSIENIYKELEKKGGEEKFEKVGIKKRVIELLKAGKEEAEFSKMLATIRRDAPIEFSIPDKGWRESFDLEKAKNLFENLQFRTMGARLEQVLNKESGSSSANLHTNKIGAISNGLQKLEEENTNPEELEEVKIALWVADSNKTDPSLDDVLRFGNTKDLQKAKEVIFAELKKRDSEFIFEKIERPLMPIIHKMEQHGVLIDAEFLNKLNEEYSKELQEVEKKIWREAGEKFNVSSPKQLSAILFEKLNLSFKNQKKTALGAKSTRESELEKMKKLHPIVPHILEYREISKLISTYIEPIPKLLDENSRLHARFLQAGAATGRMASKNPNMQNIPIGTDRGRMIRRAFTSPQGYKLIAFDYSQVELRIAAILSGDKKLIDIFKNAEDVHTGVASSMFRVAPQDVTKEMRRQAKVINFGILYGMGVNALQQNLETDRKTAQEFYNKYFSEFKGLAEYLEQVKEDANRLGYTKTFFGRRRYFEGIKSHIPYIRAAAERMAINAPMQGTQADIIKLAMIEIDDWIKKENLEEKAHLIMQVHDELVYEVLESEVNKVTPEIKKIMEHILPAEKSSGVPIVANSACGNNYGELK